MRITRSVSKALGLNIGELFFDATRRFDFDGHAESENEEVVQLDALLPAPQPVYPPACYPTGPFVPADVSPPKSPPQQASTRHPHSGKRWRTKVQSDPRPYPSKKVRKRLNGRDNRADKHAAKDEKNAPLTDEEGEKYPYGTADNIKSRRIEHINAKLLVSKPQDINFEGLNFMNGHVAEGGYRGRRKEVEPKEYDLDELERDGFEHLKDIDGGIDWNGQDPYAIIDQKRKGAIFLGGQPGGRSWQGTPGVAESVPVRAAAAVEKAATKISFDEDHIEHRRGRFRVMANGLGFGGGRKVAGQTKNSIGNQRALDELCADKDIQRVTGFQTACFQAYIPACYAFYKKTLHKLLTWSDNLLRPPFVKRVFAAVTFNFGPSTVSWFHTDDANAIWGWCPITALGNYDWKKGGHLVILELKLIIPFPPGSTILIPSALLTHGNTKIQEGERRYSITQYSASGLFRWVENGMMSDKTYLENASAARKDEFYARREARWRKGLKLFPVLEEGREIVKVDEPDAVQEVT